MDLFDLQTTLTVAVILTATAVVVLLDYMRRHRQRQPERIKVSKAARPIRSTTNRSTTIFNPAPADYSPPRKLPAEPPAAPTPAPATAPRQPAQLRAELSPEPVVPIATLSRPPIERRIERETVTVEMAPPSPPAPSGSSAASTPSTSLQTFTLPEFTIDAALWERLIASQPQGQLKGKLLASADVDPQPVDQPPSPSRVLDTIEASYKMIQEKPRHLLADNEAQPQGQPQPLGMIQQPTLEKWLETEQRFTGLVVSISINDSDSGMWHTRGLMQSVGDYIAGLLRAKDYYCRTGYDEFLIVCPGELGAQAQRRLNHISERLWDYQLRGIGACSILFSWGGIPVENQPLADAVASATERMRETKRSAKSAFTHRQAV